MILKMNGNLKLLFGLTFLVTICGLIEAGNTTEKVIYCYYGTWAHYRNGNGRFEPSHIDPFLCTHISYTFFGLSEQGELRVLDPWLDLDSGLSNIKRTIALKQINPKLKIIAAIGGWNEGSINYSNMAADPNKRQIFIKSVLRFLKEHQFDGFDLDWEYPAQRGGAPADRVNFVTLLKELQQSFAPYGYELITAVAASEFSAKISFNIPEMAKHVNYINVMTYDFATGYEGVLSFNAPLHGQGVNNVEASIKFWLNQGAPASKLILGLAMYAHTFQLANPAQVTAGSPSNGPGKSGPYTFQAGMLGYNEVCETTNNWQYGWDDKHGVPYKYRNDQWIGYDDERSIALKIELLNSLNLAGAMLWSIEMDDFRGICGVKYPLLRTINLKLGKDIHALPSSPTSTDSNTSSVDDCPSNGLYANPKDCSRFHQCLEGIRFDFNCPPGEQTLLKVKQQISVK
uniref:GH18 domain-containing protein n=1 Tax=Glossina brevipalpis TaxID=37001 RepID=A0A1A9WQI7_9MUSC